MVFSPTKLKMKIRLAPRKPPKKKNPRKHRKTKKTEFQKCEMFFFFCGQLNNNEGPPLPGVEAFLVLRRGCLFGQNIGPTMLLFN